MACLVNRNSQNKITEVQTPQGQRSKLFDAIHSIPYLAGSETSLEIFKNAYSDKVEDGTFETYDTAEPRVFFMSEKGNIYNSIEDVIVNKERGKVKAGFRNQSTKEFSPIVEFDTQGGEISQFVTSAIDQGFLSAERVLMPDGSTRYQGKGSDVITKKTMARAAKFDFATENGREGVEVFPDGTLRIKPDTTGTATVVNEDNTTTVVRIEDIPEIVKKHKPKNYDDLMATYIFYKMNYKPLANQSSPRTNKQLDNILKNFKSFLESLGFSATTLEAYRERYNTIYGKDPDIRAIADIANKVVAFAEGSISIESLSEEVAHIAIEFHNDQNSIVSALANVHLTTEYKEFSEFYRAKYSEFYEGAKLEEQVRKEVLGKILKNEFLDRFSKEGKSEERIYLIDRLKEIWQNFVQSVRDRFRPSHTRDLQQLTKKLADNVLEAEMSSFDIFKEGADFFYDAMTEKGKGIEKSLILAKKQQEIIFENLLKKKGVPNAAELESIQEDMADIEVVRAFNSMAEVAVTQAESLKRALKDAENTGEALTGNHQGLFDSLSRLKETLNVIKTQVKNIKSTSADVTKAVKSSLANVENLGKTLDEVGPEMDKNKSERAQKLVEEHLEKSNISQKEKEDILKKVDMMEKDQSVIGKTFGLVSQVANPLINLIGKKVIDMFTRVQEKFLTEVNPFINKAVSKGWEKYQRTILQKDENGKATHYYEGPLLEYLYIRDKEAKQVELIEGLTDLKKEDIVQKLKTASPRAIINNTAKYRQFAEGMKQWEILEGNETRFSEEYERVKKERYDTAEVSDVTREYIKNKNAGRFERQSKYLNKDGTIDNSKRTEEDRYADSTDAQTHKKIKEPYIDGEVREGLEIIDSKDLTPAKIESLKKEGRFPKGLSIDSAFKGNLVVIAKGRTVDELSEPSRISLELNNLDIYYRQQIKDGGKSTNPNTQFVEMLKTIEADQGSAYEWLMDNSSLVLNDEFYSRMGDKFESYADLVNKYRLEELDGEESIRVAKALEDIKEREVRKKSILKAYRKSNNPLETDANNMLDGEQKKVLTLEDEIRELKRDINLPSKYYEDAITTETTSEKRLTEDFYSKLKESGKTFLEFAMEHMTTRDSFSTSDFSLSLMDKLKGRGQLKPAFRNFVERAVDNKVVNDAMTFATVPQSFVDSLEGQGHSEDDMVRLYIHSKLTEEFAKSKVASYYQRYEPKGYSAVLDALKSGKIKASVLFSENAKDEATKKAYLDEFKALKYIDINPDYTWTQDISNEEFQNKNYKLQDYYLQPKLYGKDGKPKYINLKFFEKYGLNVQKFVEDPNGDIFSQQPTKNHEEFEFLKSMVQFREKELELYGNSGTVSKWLRPQQHRNNFESIVAIFDPSKKANIKERLKDAFQVRQHEMDYGQIADAKMLEETGMSIEVRAVPKYFQTKLEDPSEITDNVMESALHSYKQALLYKERVAAEADFNALLYKVGEQRFVQGSNGKRKSSIGASGQLSNYQAMAEDYINYGIYGVKQTRKLQSQIAGRTVDFTKAINTLQSWTRFSNLAYNWIIDATSLTTGLTVNLSDRWTGQYYHSSSANRGNNLTLNVFKYISEEGKLDKKSGMSSMLELFGVLKAEDRLQNSGFGRGLRLIVKSPSMGGEISNLGIKPKILNNILSDTRFIDGHFRSWPEYVNYRKSLDKATSKKDIEKDFKAASKESVYDFLEITPDGAKYNSKFKDKFGENAESEFTTLVSNVASKVNVLVQLVDTVISESDKTVAQRDILSNTLMMHKGWMPINMTKRFKSKHFDFHTNMEEEGHYSTLLNLMSDSVKGWREGKGLVASFKEAREELSYGVGVNMKRTAVDAGILLSLFLLLRMMFSGDDDDESYLKTMAQYILLRTASEVSSADMFGLGNSIVGVAKSPITAISTVEALEPINLARSLFSFDKGEYYKLGKKLSPLRRYDQMSDLTKQMNSYYFFNRLKLLEMADPKGIVKVEEAREKKRLKEEQEEQNNRNK